MKYTCICFYENWFVFAKFVYASHVMKQSKMYLFRIKTEYYIKPFYKLSMSIKNQNVVSANMIVLVITFDEVCFIHRSITVVL